jgi:hypothetical protein
MGCGKEDEELLISFENQIDIETAKGLSAGPD